MDECVVRWMKGRFGVIAELPQQLNWVYLWVALWEEGHGSWALNNVRNFFSAQCG